MAHDVVTTVLSAAVAQNGTFTTAYPTGGTSGNYSGGYDHRMVIAGGGRELLSPADFTLSFGSSTVTVTWLGATTIAAGTTIRMQYHKIGQYPWGKPALLSGVSAFAMHCVEVNLGSPAAGAANNLSVSASVTAASATGAVLLALASSLDVPRNVVAAWTGTAVLTVRGTDVYGNALTESSASGTSFTGKKAFKTVTSVKVSADVTGCTVGTGNVLGLPIFLAQGGNVLRELQDGVAPTAGTIVEGKTAAATATTGDIRGTYAPNATPDGSKAFALIVAVPAIIKDAGVAQYAG